MAFGAGCRSVGYMHIDFGAWLSKALFARGRRDVALALVLDPVVLAIEVLGTSAEVD